MNKRFKAVVEKVRQDGGENLPTTQSSEDRRKSFWDTFADAMKNTGPVQKKVAKLQRKMEETGGMQEHADVDRLEDTLQLRHLKHLRDLFMRHRPPAQDQSLPRHRQKKDGRQPGHLNMDELKEFVMLVTDDKQYSDQIETLFAKLDTSCDGFVDWSEFCTYLLLYLKENDLLANKRERLFASAGRLKHLTMNKQEATARVIFTENPMKLVCVSKNGCLSVWTPSGTYENSALCYSDEGIHAKPGRTRRFHMWVMDAVYMHNCHTIAVSSTGRDIHFFDYGSGLLHEEALLYGFTDVLLCLDYWYDRREPNDPSYLVCGDEMGNVFFITLQRPTQQFFDVSSSADELHKIWLPEIEQHSRYIKVECIPAVHSDAILQIRYLADNHCTISASSSPTESIVIYDLTRRQAIYTFLQRRGCQCFHLHRGLNLLVTGSVDHLIRVWNPYVTNRPTAIIEGHHAPIISVYVMASYGSLVSFSSDCVIKVWDIKDQRCLQTVQVKVPGFHALKLPEFLQSPLHMNESNNISVCVASDFMLVFKLGKPPEPPSLIPKSHQAPLCGVIYNESYKQIVTGCDLGVITTWDVETGNKALMLPGSHQGEEITAMAFDESKRKLVTGSRNGSVCVWNMQNGQCLHHLLPADDSEVTGFYWSEERNLLYTIGWSRQIVKYDVSKSQTYKLAPHFTWKSGVVHKEDILCCDVCPPNFMVTGSYDGELILWSLDTEVILQKLRQGRQEPVWRSVTRIQASKNSISSASTRHTSRPNSRHRVSHKAPIRGMPIPVDCLKFLKHRILTLKSSGALLLSSDAGVINWWRIFGAPLHVGNFYAASKPDKAILSLCCSQTDAIMAVGDSAGAILLWDISNYCLRDTQIAQWNVKPPLIRTFTGHEGAIVGLEMIQHDTGRYIVTASTDATAKLFTLLGECVGTFGQKIPWQLKYRKSWAEYKDAYYLDEEDIPRQQAARDSIAIAQSIPETVEEMGLSDSHVYHSAFITRFSKETTMMTTSDLDTVHEQDVINEVESSTMMPMMMQAMRRSKTILGVKAEQDLQRIRDARYNRRNAYGEVNVNKTVRFGSICSPYSALSTMNLQSHMISPNLPVPGTRRDSQDAKDIADVAPEHLVEVDPFLHNFTAFQQSLAQQHQSQQQHQQQQMQQLLPRVHGGGRFNKHSKLEEMTKLPKILESHAKQA